jgi:hypothetical protein
MPLWAAAGPASEATITIIAVAAKTRFMLRTRSQLEIVGMT